MMVDRQRMGRWGEHVAEGYLRQRGYTILGRNVRQTHGEIDLIARQGTVLVFVEVKTRSNSNFGWPEEAVNSRKREHILAAIDEYLQANPELETDWRVDVIAIVGTPSTQEPAITHFENAITQF